MSEWSPSHHITEAAWWSSWQLTSPVSPTHWLSLLLANDSAWRPSVLTFSQWQGLETSSDSSQPMAMLGDLFWFFLANGYAWRPPLILLSQCQGLETLSDSFQPVVMLGGLLCFFLANDSPWKPPLILLNQWQCLETSSGSFEPITMLEVLLWVVSANGDTWRRPYRRFDQSECSWFSMIYFSQWLCDITSSGTSRPMAGFQNIP